MSEYLRKIDALVAEKVMRWVRVQPPKWDYDGPLPEQGEVLVPFRLVSAIDEGRFEWPPRGIIPFHWMVPHFSVNPSATLEVEDHLLSDGWAITVLKYNSRYMVALTKEGEEFHQAANTRGLALCKCALEAYGVEVPLEEGEDSV